MRKAAAVFRMCFCAIVALASVVDVAAAMRRIDPGEAVELRDGEGFVVVAVETSQDLRVATLRQEGRYFGAGGMRNPTAGQNYDLYVAEAGRYHWHELKTAWIRWRLGDDYAFDVKPGVINYPGDLVFRSSGWYSAQGLMSNRGLAAIDWLRANHPTIEQAHAFTYSGRYPDPFPAFFRESPARAVAPRPGFGLGPPPKAARPFPIDVAELWRASAIIDADLNDEGRLVLLQEKSGDDQWDLSLIDLEANVASLMVRSAAPLVDVQWVGDRTFVAALHNPLGRGQANVFHLAPGGDTGRRWVATRTPIETPADIIQTFATPQPSMIVVTTSRRGIQRLERVDLRTPASVAAFKPDTTKRLNKGLDEDLNWFFDLEGRLALALVRTEEGLRLVRLTDGAAEEVMSVDEDLEFVPIGISGDGRRVFGIAEEGRSQRELVAYDLQQRKLLPTLFSRPGVDVVSAIFDAAGEVAGVRYYRSGRLASEYFDDAEARAVDGLDAAFPGRSVSVIDRSRDGAQRMLWIDGPDMPPAVFHFDVAARRASAIANGMPWLEDERLAPSTVVAFTGADGLPLEAFLTRPPGIERPPLVVYPHGGPIGVADTLHFDPSVQFMASLGYAVLQVNFRGSDGYGSAFRDAANRNFGTLIEDDIDAAVRHVLAQHPLDETRMCMVGASYGGYSGLVAAVRWPDRYRCVVAMAGLSDRALFFTASDSVRDEKVREEMERRIGNPNTDLEAMMATSPLYHADRIKAAVMLVHGGKDLRADPEHARRLARMLEGVGRPAVGYVFEDEAHGIDDEDHRKTAWEGIAGFLQQHLDAGAHGAQKASSPAGAPAAPSR